MPIVRIDWVEGRSTQQKQELAARITTAVADVAGVEVSDVWIVFRDVAAGDWAAGGALVRG